MSTGNEPIQLTTKLTKANFCQGNYWHFPWLKIPGVEVKECTGIYFVNNNVQPLHNKLYSPNKQEGKIFWSSLSALPDELIVCCEYIQSTAHSETHTSLGSAGHSFC